MQHADADEDNNESDKSETESETKSDDDNSEISESSTELFEHVDIEARKEALGNQRVAFNVPGSSEENTSTDDVDASSDENNISVMNEDDQEINISVISEEITTTTTQRSKRSVKRMQCICPMVSHATNGKESTKKTIKHGKGKRGIVMSMTTLLQLL